MEDASSFRDMIKDEDFAREAENKLDTAEERRTKELNNLESELERDPDNTNKISRLADLYRDDGRMKDALNLLEKASERQPENYQIREKLGDVRIEICDRALKKVASRLQDNPDDKTLRKRRDALNEKRKKIAVKEYEWRVQQHPTDNALRFQLGRAYYDVGKVNKAIGAFQKAARETHLVVEAAEMLGRCFMAKEQYDLAEEQFNRAIERYGRSDDRGMELHYQLARSLEKRGDESRALEIYKKIYSNDIDFRDVADKVDELS